MYEVREDASLRDLPQIIALTLNISCRAFAKVLRVVSWRAGLLCDAHAGVPALLLIAYSAQVVDYNQSLVFDGN